MRVAAEEGLPQAVAGLHVTGFGGLPEPIPAARGPLSAQAPGPPGQHQDRRGQHEQGQVVEPRGAGPEEGAHYEEREDGQKGRPCEEDPAARLEGHHPVRRGFHPPCDAPPQAHQGILRRGIVAEGAAAQGGMGKEPGGGRGPAVGLLRIRRHPVAGLEGPGQPGCRGTEARRGRPTVPGLGPRGIRCRPLAGPQRLGEPEGRLGMALPGGLLQAPDPVDGAAGAEPALQVGQPLLEDRFGATQAHGPVQAPPGLVGVVGVAGPVEPEGLGLRRETGHPDPEAPFQQRQGRRACPRHEPHEGGRRIAPEDQEEQAGPGLGQFSEGRREQQEGPQDEGQERGDPQPPGPQGPGETPAHLSVPSGPHPAPAWPSLRRSRTSAGSAGPRDPPRGWWGCRRWGRRDPGPWGRRARRP